MPVMVTCVQYHCNLIKWISSLDSIGLCLYKIVYQDQEYGTSDVAQIHLGWGNYLEK